MRISVIIFSLVLGTCNCALGVELLAPNGGEVLEAGSTYIITWESEAEFANELNVSIKYSIDGGQNWEPVISMWNQGWYEWTVPAINSDECLVRIELYLICILVIEPCPAADVDWDWDVDLNDFAILAASWGSMPGDYNWDPNCDISEPADEIINELDLEVLAKWWLIGKYDIIDTSDGVFSIFEGGI
ncbi:MAG: hypothetical protein JSW23_03085 [Planctomycetota bacterium]|nr:MAG: hypothetical protein JSW23_03085 [Planctomycetota bacterium]